MSSSTMVLRTSRRRVNRHLAAAVSTVLAISLLHVPAQAATERGAPALPKQAAAAKGTSWKPEKPKPDPSANKTMRSADAVAWPTGGSGEVDAARSAEKLHDVGGLLIDVSSTARGESRSLAPAPQRVRVEVLGRATSDALGLDGPVFRLHRSGGQTNGKVNVRVGYRKFAHAHGGDWGARLRLAALPACALISPDRRECHARQMLATVNDNGAQVLSADVDIAASASNATVFTVAAAQSSAQGDYKATKLSPSSSWSVGMSAGNFSWTYPIRVPGTPGGLIPQVGLGYSSQAVDGRTAATNNQGSWIGEGFSYEPGYIERRYQPCKHDGHAGSGEQCWAFPNGTMMLAGRSGALVRVNDNLWKLSADDGSKIERLTGATNGDDNGEYWKVTTTDGSQYFFGSNRLPGWSEDQEETESVWTSPVYGDDSGEPCHTASGFAQSWCQQAWRWNLDHVIDPRGNVISYFYDREINYYARGHRTDVDGTPYDRGGYLARIDYGQRADQVYSTNAPARVVFHATERCIPGGGVDCDPQDLNESTARSWPDVPEDLICPASTHCEATQVSPTFFTRKRLAKIETQVRQGAGWQAVESWSLEHDFKANDDNSRTLWLKKIVETGHWGDPDITLPATELDGIQLPNRIDRDGDDIGPLVRFRLAAVKTNSGSQISIGYKAIDCSKDDLPAVGESTRRCFPVVWNPFGGGAEHDITDWFHKYVVRDVVVDDLVGGNPDMVTAYDYIGEAAWRKVEPDGMTLAKYQTWSDWRGYAHVVMRTGDGQVMPTRVDHFYLRGMSGGLRPDGTRLSVSRTDSTGTAYVDHDEWSGHHLETVVYDGADVISKVINQPFRHITHTQTEAWGVKDSAFAGTNVVRKLGALPDDPEGNGVWRETKTITTFDTAVGRVTRVDDVGDVTSDADDVCTRTWYADNPGKHMYTYVSRVQAVSVKCDVASPNLATELISDTRTSYDFQVWDQPPTLGRPTLTEDLDKYDGTKVVYIAKSRTTAVDAYGRPTTNINAVGDATTTEYTETDGLTTQVKVTSPAPFSFVTTTTKDPAFGVPTAIVDMNLNRTELTYDSMGRLSAVWLANRKKSLGATPSMKFGYNVRKDKTTVVTTERVNNDGSYRRTHELADGLMRLRQTQMPGPSGGWIVTDTFYNGTGQVAKQNDAYLVAGTPADTPIVAPEGSVNGQTSTVFDGAGRPVAGTLSAAGSPLWTTTTTYDGDRTHVTPPDGGVPTTIVTDARGRTTELHQHRGINPSGPADVTRYTYTPAGSLETVTDAAGNRWVHHYNQRNLKVWTEDPDAGDLRYTYDSLGNLATTADERGNVLSYKYDQLGRKTEMWQGAVGTGTKLAAWVFDTLTGNKGQLHYSRRFRGDSSYTTTYMTRDKLYRPLSLSYSFPQEEVGGLLGKSYQFTTAYNNDGTVQSYGFPSGGGLPAEAVVVGYDSLLRPTTLTGTSSYVTAASYGNVGELLQVELHTGGSDKKAWLSWAYERGTGRLKSARVDRHGLPTADLDAHYSYDPAGNVLSIADNATLAGGIDVQCFDYDYQRRLTEAWTHNSTTKTCADGVAQTGVGGPAPYHHSWTFDRIGNRDTEAVHSVADGASTVREYDFPAAGEAQPHTLLGVTETGPGGNKTHTYGYDASGNTTCRPAETASNTCANGAGSQALTWDPEGRLHTSTPPGGQPTTYIYDADGNRIARKEPGGSTTIYMPGMELASSGLTVTGTRYYSFAGKSVAVRNSSGVHFQASDHHGTAVCSINASTGAITWRRTTPYGSVRGGAPTAWPDQKGFVGGTQDPTGLTHLGAREYDAAVGRFVSVDPLIDPNNPGELGGYAYAANNPVTNSDPTGLRPFEGDEGVSYPPLTFIDKDVLTDENGVRHQLTDQGKPENQRALGFLNNKLRESGNLLDPNTGTGSIFVLQDEDHPLVAKQIITGADGQPTVTGTTADAVKISFIDGKVVSVDTYDFTGTSRTGDEGLHENTVRNKLGFGAKQKYQTQNVIFFAIDDAQAAEMRRRFADDPNVRIVNPTTGYDSGELISKTHAAALKARGIQPRTPAQTGKTTLGGRAMGALGALSLVGDIYMLYQLGDALSTKDRQQREVKLNMIACSMFSPSCRDMVFTNGYIYHYDGWEWVNTGVKASEDYASTIS